MTKRTPPILRATVLALLVGVPVATSTACAVCSVEADCAGNEFCLEGACVPAPPARVSFLGPRGPVGETFEAVVELGFRGGEATVTLERAIDAIGEPCLPFPPVVRVVEGDVDAYVTRVLVFPGLPALGPDFGLTARVEVNGGVISAGTLIVGPPVPGDVGGIIIRSPRDTSVDVVVNPLLSIEVETDGIARAYIEPTLPSVAPSTPRRALTLDGGAQRGTLPVLHGPQNLWVESIDSAGGVQRCGHGLTGTAGVATEGELEVMLFSRSAEGDPHLVELSTRVTGTSGEAFCDGRSETELSCRSSAAAREDVAGLDGLLVDVADGVVEIAVLPRVISGPVDVEVRVGRGGRHLGMFGPLTIQPALGETWVAGRVIMQGGEVFAVVEASEAPRAGLPW